MSRRALTLIAVLLAVVLSAGCEAPAGYAAKVGNGTISQDQLDQHLKEWAGSEKLLEAVGSSSQAVPGLAPGSWSMPFADYVLTTMIDFELHDQEFEHRHLEVDPQTVSAVEATLIGEDTPKVWADVSPEFKQYLIDSIARQDAVQTALGDDYATWRQDQYERGDIDVNPRYGSWSATGGVIAPAGPQPVPVGS